MSYHKIIWKFSTQRNSTSFLLNYIHSLWSNPFLTRMQGISATWLPHFPLLWLQLPPLPLLPCHILHTESQHHAPTICENISILKTIVLTLTGTDSVDKIMEIKMWACLLPLVSMSLQDYVHTAMNKTLITGVVYLPISSLNHVIWILD